MIAPPPLTDAKVLGNTRLDVVSREARALGICPGQTVAQARARAANLTVRVVRPEAVQDVLARLAEVALAFGATVSFAMAGQDAASFDVVWVDVTGCAHLHAARYTSNDSSVCEGETVLASRLAQVFRGLGHQCTVAMADGPRVAAILARAAALSSSSSSSSPSPRKSARGLRHVEDSGESGRALVVPPGKNALALAPLPVAALPITAEDVRWLAKLGVHTIAALRALPRVSLAARLGAKAPVVFALAEGDDRAPLAAYVPPEIPEEEVSLEYGISGSEALTFVAKTLTGRLASRLAGRGVAASRLELDLLLDVALIRASEEAGAAPYERTQRLVLELPSPLSSEADLLAALRPKIDRAVLRAPVLGAKLRAASLVHKPQAALSLFESAPKAERVLPRLVAELAADLGEEAVGRLVLGDSWIPEERSCFVRFEAKSKTTFPGGKARSRSEEVRGRKRRHMLSSVPEPTRLVSPSVAVPREAVNVVRHLSRLESVDWWKRPPTDVTDVRRAGFDYVHAWVEEGSAWVELDRATGNARIRGWFD